MKTSFAVVLRRALSIVLLVAVVVGWSGCASKNPPMVSRGPGSDGGSGGGKTMMEPVGSYSPTPIKIRRQ